MSMFLVVFLYATWSSVFSFAKIALEFSTPTFLTGFRMLLASVLLLGYLAIAKRSSFKLSGKQILSFVALGFFSVYLSNVLEFWGLKYLTAAKACFIYSLSPFFAALFSYLHFGEKMNGRKWLGFGVGMAGMIPVIVSQSGTEELMNAFSIFSWPALALMGAALAAVYGWVLLRVLVKDSTNSPVMANGASMFFGGSMAIIHSLCIDKWSPVPIETGAIGSFIPIVLLITFISNIVCYNLYGFMLKRFTATFLSFMGLLSPVFASLHGWIFLGEIPSWTIFLSTAILCLGLWIVYSAELKQGYMVKTTPQPEKI